MPTKEELLQYARDMAEAFGYDADSAVSRAEQGIADGTLKTYSDVRRALMSQSQPTDTVGEPEDEPVVPISEDEIDQDIVSADQLATPTETPTDPTPVPRTTPTTPKGAKYSNVKISDTVNRWRPLVQKYFGDLGSGVVENMLAVMQLESGGRPDAHNNKGEDSRGLFQINVGPGASTQYASLNLFDPEVNVRKARELYDRRGYQPWTAAQKLGLTEDRGYQRQARTEGGVDLETETPRIADDPRFTQNPPYGGGRQLGDIMGDLGQFKDQLSGLSPFAAERFLPFGPNKDEMDRTANNLLRFMGMNADIGNPVVDQLRQFITQSGAPTARILDVLGGSEDVLAPGSEELGSALGRRAGTVMDFIGKGGAIPNPQGTIAQILDAQRRVSANDETLPVGLQGFASGLGDAESVIREILPMFYGRVAPDLMPYWKQGIRKREEQFRNTAPDQTFLDFVFGR